MTSSDLEWLSEIFNDTKHRMVSLQQLSFLSRWWPYAILNLHNLEFVMWLLSPCYSAYRRRNLLKLDSWLLKVVIKRFSIWRPSANLNFKNFHIWSHLCHRVQVCCCVPNFIKIGWFFIEIWRFNDFQDGGCFPPWILWVQQWVFFWKAYLGLVVNRDHSYKLLCFLRKSRFLYAFWRQTKGQRALILYRRRRFINHLLTYLLTYKQTDGQHNR